MAVEIKSINQLIADMVRRIAAETDVTDFNAGSVIVSLLEAAAISDYQNQVSILKVLESMRLESLVGADLDTKAIEMNIPNGQGGIGRIPALRSNGTVTIGSAFTKLSTEFYLGKPAPYSGGLTLYLQDATSWPSSGQIYIGRGSGNEEGPLTYLSVTDQGTYFAMTLSATTPLLRSHRYDEQVVLSQGGVRLVAAGTRLLSPAVDNVPQVEFLTDESLTLLDGESAGTVRATCTQFGEQGNVVAGSVSVFSSVPFPGATVTNELAFVNGAAAETDESLRQRIKNYPATLSKGTRTAIAAALQNLRDPVSGKTIASLNVVEPTAFGEPARCYIDDGTGLEPATEGQAYEDLLASANGQEILFRTAKAPVTACLQVGTEMGPFQLPETGVLTVTLDGITEVFAIRSADFVNINAVSAAELVNSLNSQGENVAFRTAGGGKYISVFDASGKGEIMTVGAGDVQSILGFSTRDVRPIYLFKNNQLLSFKGATATLTTAAFPWYNQTEIVDAVAIIDGVSQTFSVNDASFAEFGTLLSTATLAQWATVLKRKIAGANIYPVTSVGGGSALVWETWQTDSSDGSVEIVFDSQWVGTGRMWAVSQVLTSVGSGADYEFNRLLGQIRLLDKPNVGDSITIASDQTRAMLKSGTNQTGSFSAGISSVGNPRLIVAVDGDFAIRVVGYPVGATFSPVTSPSLEPSMVRLVTGEYVCIANIEVGDYVSFVRDTAQTFAVSESVVGVYQVKMVGPDGIGGGFIEIQAADDIVVEFLAAGAISIGATTFTAFKCEGALPQIVDFGASTTLTSDEIVEICSPQLTGASFVKLSPQQFAVRSDNFQSDTSLAVFSVIGTAQGFFDPAIYQSIDPHVGVHSSGEIFGGFAKVQDVVGSTPSSGWYPKRSYLVIDRTFTDVVDSESNPSIEMAATVTSYPVGLQEIPITGRNIGNVFRSYNLNAIAPFAGFARGESVFKPSKQSTTVGNVLASNVSLRLEDLPFGVNDKLVVEMNQDPIAGTSAVPFSKKATIWTMDSVNGGQGSLIKFTLTDPDDNDLYFFDPASPYRDFDFSDFNILFKSIGLHSVYPEDSGTKLPDFTQRGVLLFQSLEFGPSHRPRLSIVYGARPNVSSVFVSHKTYIEDGAPICHLYVTLPTGTQHGSFLGGYTISFQNYAGFGSSALVEMTFEGILSDINPGGTQFRVGDILALGGTGDYVGSYLIIEASETAVKAVAPGLRRGTYTPIALDATLNPLISIEKVDLSLADLVTALNDYLPENPVITARVVSADDTVKVLYPTYFTQGQSVVDTTLETMGAYFDYHSASGHFGSLAHVYICRRLDESYNVVDEVRAVSQYADSVLLSGSEIAPDMNYSYRGEECLLIPANAYALARWLSFSSVSSLPLRAEVSVVNTGRNLQINSRERGSSGAVKVTGLSANEVIDTIKTVPAAFSDGYAQTAISYVLAQAMPRGTLVEVTNDVAVPISRAYTSISVVDPDGINSVITSTNDGRIDVFFRDTTSVYYERPVSGTGRFVFQRSLSGFDSGLSAVNSIEIEKINSVIAKVFVPSGATNTLRARLGDMFVVSNSSSALADNKCVDLSGEVVFGDVYPGYPVVHIASDTEIYVIAPNMVNDTFSLTSETDVMFVPHIKHEKNIVTNYKAGAKFKELVATGEGLYYRLMPIGGGFVYCEFGNDTDNNDLDMQLDGLSVSSDDLIYFSSAFLPANQGTFRIVAHNGKNAVVFKNDAAVAEILRSDNVIDDYYGTAYWGKGPIDDTHFSLAVYDKRHVRIWDSESVFASDLLVIASSSSSVAWFPDTLLGSWPIKSIGLTGSVHAKGAYHVYVDVSITNAPATGVVPEILLSGSASSVSFFERPLDAGDTRVVGYKWVAGAAASAVNTEYADLYIAPATSLRKMLPEHGTKLTALHKTAFSSGAKTGVDAYQYYTELIAEAHKVLDGSSENPIDYPGVRAAGSQVEVLAPLIKSIYLTFEIMPREGVTISSIKAPVRSVVSSYVNSLGVGREVVLSEIIKRSQQVPGVKSVTIVSTSPEAANGVVSVGSFEVPRILDPNNISI